MAQSIGTDKTKAAADLVLRYLIARALFRGTLFKPPKNLEYQISGGVRYPGGGVLLNEVSLRPIPAIVYDRKDPDFWAAVIGGDDSAIDMDPADLNEIRRVVLSDKGALPLPQQGQDVAQHREGSQQAPALSNSDILQRADPRNGRIKARLSRPYRAVQFLMRRLALS